MEISIPGIHTIMVFLPLGFVFLILNGKTLQVRLQSTNGPVQLENITIQFGFLVL